MSIQSDIDRGLEIVAELDRLEKELKQIETRVKQAAIKGPQVDLADADREGKQYLANGSKAIVPVIITADKLVGSFQANSKTHTRITTALGMDAGKITDFFKREVVWSNSFEDGKKFRTKAAEILDKAAPAFITACIARDKDGIPKNDVKICWADKKEVA